MTTALWVIAGDLARQHEVLLAEKESWPKDVEQEPSETARLLDQYPFSIGGFERYRTHYEQPNLDDLSEPRGPQVSARIDVVTLPCSALACFVSAEESHVKASGQLSLLEA